MLLVQFRVVDLQYHIRLFAYRHFSACDNMEWVVLAALPLPKLVCDARIEADIYTLYLDEA
jgi:hypothetical protein